jgi:hypothetical protein
MKLRLFALLVFFLSLVPVAEGAERREPMRLFGDLEVRVEFEYRAPEDDYLFDFPLYGDLGLLYQGDVVESALSVELIEEVVIGESYIMGGSGISYLKLGFFREDWGKASRCDRIRFFSSHTARVIWLVRLPFPTKRRILKV